MRQKRKISILLLVDDVADFRQSIIVFLGMRFTHREAENVTE